MDLALNFTEGEALHGLLEEASDDIVIKVDANGFIVHASANITQLGQDLTEQLVMPHIRDLSDHDHSEFVALYSEKVLNGYSGEGSVEFPVSLCECEDACNPITCRRWYSLSLRPIVMDSTSGLEEAKVVPTELCDDNAPAREFAKREVIGAVGLLRSVQRVRLLESELHSRSVTDPLTGLSNRHAFSASLRRQLANGSDQIVVVFAIDRMRSMLLQYGQRTADEIQWGFAKFLETMVRSDFELAQMDGERFGVRAPNISTAEARAWAQEVLDTFSSLALTNSPRMPRLSASAGLARLESTVDWTLRQAELALVIARAGGGMQVGQCTYQRAPSERLTGS